MSSGDKRMTFYSKKFFHLNQVRENFLNYLKMLIEETRARIFPYSGLFEEVLLTSDTIDSFDISTPASGMDAHGHEMNLETEMIGSTYDWNNVPFPNENGVVYSVGMRWNDSVPSGDSTQTPPQSVMETNARTKAPEYALLAEVIGEVGEPDSVQKVLLPSLKLVLIIDSLLLCEATPINHSGRRVLIWLDNPVSNVDEVALFTAFSKWDGVNNYVEIPYTESQGPLGQTGEAHPISIIAADYRAWVEGVTITAKSVKDLHADDDYIFLGEATGAGRGVIPSTFDTSGQTYLSRASGLAVGPVAGTPHHLDITNVQQAFESLLGWMNDHFNGDADKHPASDITTEAIAGTPYSESASDVQSVTEDVIGWMNVLATALSLDWAYDGQAGSGSGRTITADSGAVEIKTPAGGTGDKSRNALLLNGLLGGEEFASQLHIIQRGANDASNEGGQLILKPISNSTYLQIAEPASITGAKQLTLTRGGDQSLTSGKVKTKCDLAWLSGFTTPAFNNKLYRVEVTGASTVNLYSINNDEAVLTPGETGTVTFLRPVVAMVGDGFGGIGPGGTYLRGFTVLGRNVASMAAALNLFPFEQDALSIFDNAATPLRRFKLDNDGRITLENSAVIDLATTGSIVGTGGNTRIENDSVKSGTLIAITSVRPVHDRDVIVTAETGPASDVLVVREPGVGAALRGVKCGAPAAKEHAVTGEGVFRASAARADLVIAKNAERSFTFDSGEYDKGGMFAATSNQMVAPVSGIYHFDLWGQLTDGGAVTVETFYVALRHSADNRMLTCGQYLGSWPPSDYHLINANCGVDCYLAKDQYVYAVVYQCCGADTLHLTGRMTGHLVARM